MKSTVGISHRLKRAWLDDLLDRLAQTTDEKELRAFVDQRLRDELPGKDARAKASGILLRIWSGVEPKNRAFRDRAIALLPHISGQERIWLHWGMMALAYPFFRDLAEVIGRILTLQDDITNAQVQSRLKTAWGDRETSKEAAGKLITSMVDWEVLRATKTRGHFLLSRKMTTSVTNLQLWLLEAMVSASAADEIEAQQLLRLPELFPFVLTVGVGELRRHEGFNIHRQGLDMDMVAVRRVKADPQPQTTSEQKKSKKKDAPKQRRPTLFESPIAKEPALQNAAPSLRTKRGRPLAPVETSGAMGPDIRNAVKAEIKRRVQWLSNDCSTLWRVRLEMTEWYNPNAGSDGLGGGNFVMALAMLSAFNFLAKAYSMLLKPDAFVTEADRAAVKSARDIVKDRVPELKSLLKSGKTDWRSQPKGSCNETEAFGRLIKALHVDGIDLGLPPENAEAVWGRFRNKLAHMGHPNGVVEVGAADQGKPLQNARAAIRGGPPAFRKRDGRWICNADRLSLDIIDVADWICKQVDTCSELDRITNLGEWLFEDTDLGPSAKSGSPRERR